MRPFEFRLVRNLGFGLLAILFAIAVFITFAGYSTSIPQNPLLFFAFRHHVAIMLVLVILSVAFGFVWALLSYQEVQKAQKVTRSVLQVILPFMHRDERIVVDFLVRQAGEAKQADFARLDGMTRLRAHRSVRRLEEKGIVSIASQGKVRVVRLKDGLIDVLRENA